MMTALTVDQKIQLSHLEIKIERGVKATLEMAEALLEIRRDELYRADYDSFEQYCSVRWGFTDRYGRMLIDFAEVAANLSLSGTMVPPNAERQARPLAGLPAQEQAEGWGAAQTIAGNEQPSSSHTTRAAAALKTRAAAPEVGQWVQVLDEDSPYYGQEVEVLSVDGVIVEARTKAGTIIALLTNEITPQPEPAPAPEPQQRPNAFEVLERRLKHASERCLLLEGLLRTRLRLDEGYELSEAGQAWTTEVREVLG